MTAPFAIVANCCTHTHDPSRTTRLDPFENHIPYDWAVRPSTDHRPGTRSATEAASSERACTSSSSELYPICRSITGDGVRETLRRDRRARPARRARGADRDAGVRLDGAAASGTSATRRSRTAPGARVVDFAANNLHVVSYSVPVRAALPLAELRPHLHSHPGPARLDPVPDVVLPGGLGLLPARTTTLAALDDGDYEVCIDTTLDDGHLTYGECVLARRRPTDEVLISAHVCHPSLANDNLSGIAVADVPGAAARASCRGGCSYRFLFVPGHDRRDHLAARATRSAATRISTASCSTCARRPRAARRTSAAGAATPAIDRAVAHVLAHSGDRVRARSTSRPTATTSASTARPASTSRSAASCARRTAAIPSTTRRPTTSTSCARGAGGLAREVLAAILECSRATRRYVNLDPEGRAAARPARPLPARSAAAATRAERARAALGAQPLRRPARRCSTSPSARGSTFGGDQGGGRLAARARRWLSTGGGA